MRYDPAGIIINGHYLLTDKLGTSAELSCLWLLALCCRSDLHVHTAYTAGGCSRCSQPGTCWDGPAAMPGAGCRISRMSY